MDAITKYPACKIYHNANQSIANSVATGLQFNSEVFKTDNMHSTSSDISRITINTAGVYQIIANVGFDANSTGYRIVQFRANGATLIPGVIANAISSPGIGTNIAAVTLYKFNAGDFFEVFVQQNSGSDLNVISANTYAMAVKVG